MSHISAITLKAGHYFWEYEIHETFICGEATLHNTSGPRLSVAKTVEGDRHYD